VFASFISYLNSFSLTSIQHRMPILILPYYITVEIIWQPKGYSLQLQEEKLRKFHCLTLKMVPCLLCSTKQQMVSHQQAQVVVWYREAKSSFWYNKNTCGFYTSCLEFACSRIPPYFPWLGKI